MAAHNMKLSSYVVIYRRINTQTLQITQFLKPTTKRFPRSLLTVVNNVIIGTHKIVHGKGAKGSYFD